MNTKRSPTHVGWLLACDAESNIAKGIKQFALLSADEQLEATAYRDHCLKVYKAAKGAQHDHS